MNRHRLSIALLVALATSLTAAPVLAQSATITGSVVDAATGDGLPGATIQIEGRFVGTITNEAGRFSLPVNNFPATLVARFIGYRSVARAFSSAPDGPVRFALEPTTLEMPEIVVTGENPAINIMRRVIEEKRRWWGSFETYRVNAYNRFRLENDSGIVSIWESSTLAFWDRERGIREISLAQKQTENMAIDELLPAALFMTNLYDDDVEVAGHTLMGVTNSDALDYYEFSLAGTRAMDNRLVYDIAVRPKSNLGSGFIGSVAVLDSVYALLAVDLEPGASFLFPPPIRELTVRHRQQFSRFGSDVWLPVDLRSSVTLDLSFGALLSFPTFHIEQSARLSDFELNVPVPDSLYESDDVVAADSTLTTRAELAKLEEISIPLTAEEVRAYETIDSTMTLTSAFKPKGLLARFVEMSDDSDDENRSNRRRRSGSSTLSEQVRRDGTPELWFNRVEGWHLGFAPSLQIANFVRLGGREAYQTARKAWSYGANAHVGRRAWIEAGFMDHVAQRYESDIHERFLNSVSVLALQPDYFDYVREQRLFVGAGLDVPGLRDLEFALRFEDATYRNVARAVEKTWFGTPDSPIPNAEIDEGTLQAIVLNASYSRESIPFGIGGAYEARVAIERSVGGSIVDDGQFTRIDGVVAWRIPTFYRRRLLPNALDFRIAAGTFSGNLPRQRFGIVDGSTLFTTFGGLKTRRDRPYEAESYLLIAAEHSFRSIFFERLGLRSLARKSWNVILTGAVARMWTSDNPSAAFLPSVASGNRVHSEIGVSLSGLFGVVRIDYSRRLDRPGDAIGISAARIF